MTAWKVGTMPGGFGAWKKGRLIAGPFTNPDAADSYVVGVLRNASLSALIRETVPADESHQWSIPEAPT
jgi:hypothetical protein